MGAALSFLGQKLFAGSTLINAKCENISCCTSVAAVQPLVVRRTGGFLRKGMTTIYVDSRKRVAGSDSDFEVDLGESLHLQSDARLAVYKIRLADSFLSTDRGRYLYWVDAALGTLNWALLPEGAYTGARLAAWISSNFATATYGETTNSLSVAYDGNRLILNDLELRQQFPDAADYPSAPAASPTKPFSIVLGGVLGQLRAESLRGCKPRGPCAYEVRCRLRAVCSAAQAVRDGGRPLPVAGQGAGLGVSRQVVLNKAGSAVPLVPLRQPHVLVRGLCGELLAEACAAEAAGWGPRWTLRNRPGRSGL